MLFSACSVELNVTDNASATAQPIDEPVTEEEFTTVVSITEVIHPSDKNQKLIEAAYAFVSHRFDVDKEDFFENVVLIKGDFWLNDSFSERGAYRVDYNDKTYGYISGLYENDKRFDYTYTDVRLKPGEAIFPTSDVRFVDGRWTVEEDVTYG